MNVFKLWSSVVVVILLSSVLLTGCGPSVPAAPTGVSATPGNGQVTITWTAVSDAASYNIYWSSTSGVTPTNGNRISNATSPFMQTGLANGTTYFYVVTAVNGAGG